MEILDWLKEIFKSDIMIIFSIAVLGYLLGSILSGVQGRPFWALLSMLLTIIGGLIPSKKAATKDPVIALRTE